MEQWPLSTAGWDIIILQLWFIFLCNYCLIRYLKLLRIAMPGNRAALQRPKPFPLRLSQVTPWPSQRVWSLLMKKIHQILNYNIPQLVGNVPKAHFPQSTGWCPRFLPGNQETRISLGQDEAQNSISIYLRGEEPRLKQKGRRLPGTSRFFRRVWLEQIPFLIIDSLGLKTKPSPGLGLWGFSRWVSFLLLFSLSFSGRIFGYWSGWGHSPQGFPSFCPR